MSEDQQERTHDPSQRRLEEARKRGDVPRSTDLTSAAGWLGLILALAIWGSGIVSDLGSAGMIVLGQSDRIASGFPPASSTGGGMQIGLTWQVLRALIPVFLLPMALAALALAVQKALIFTPDNLLPKLSRISPTANAGKKFGRAGLLGFLKVLAKMIAVATCLWLYLSRQSDRLIGSSSLSGHQVSSLLITMVTEFLVLVCALALVMGGVDYCWQRFEHLRRNRMSRQELTDEVKDSEGDPQFRAHRRQRAREIATNRMLKDVASADVIVVNPTHYAVALRWNRATRGAPVCVAKGVDEIAARIRERAANAGVPVHSDPPTARALYATVDLGAQIRPEHYVAIAAAIRFADKMRRKHRKEP